MSKKEAYEQNLQVQLEEWNARIKLLKAKAEKAEADAKVRYYDELDLLREKQSVMRHKMQELKNAGDDAWEDLKDGINKARDSLKDALADAASRF